MAISHEGRDFSDWRYFTPHYIHHLSSNTLILVSYGTYIMLKVQHGDIRVRTVVARERFELSSTGPEPAMLDHYTTGLFLVSAKKLSKNDFIPTEPFS